MTFVKWAGRIALGLMLGLLGSPSLFAAVQQGFGYHGYMRVGTSLSKDHTQGSCYNLKNAGGNAFRYGNECSLYMENRFDYTYPMLDDDSKIWFRSAVNIALVSDLLQNMESTKDNDLEIGLREAYVEGGNVLTEGSVLWVGKRFYKRRDIYLLDLFLTEPSGVGAGVYDLAAGPGKAHFAFMQYRSRTSFTVGEETAVSPLLSALDLRYDHALLAGNLEYIVMLAQKSGEPADGLTEIEYEKLRGWELGLIYTFDSPTLRNRSYLQYGRGLFGASLAYGNMLNGFESDGSTVVKTASSSAERKQIEDSSTLRVAQDLIFTTEQWETALALVYQVEEFGSAPIPNGKAKPRRMLIGGVEPGYFLNPTKTWKLIYNSGYIAINNNWKPGDADQSNNYLYKNTVAIQVARGPGYFIRPVFRLYASDARWSNGAKAYLDGLTGTFANGRKGLSVGVQAEAWW